MNPESQIAENLSAVLDRMQPLTDQLIREFVRQRLVWAAVTFAIFAVCIVAALYFQRCASNPKSSDAATFWTILFTVISVGLFAALVCLITEIASPHYSLLNSLF